MSDQSRKQPKVINDPIHGHIEFHPLCGAIIDTPPFQRLRRINQLGGCYFVYPGASHNRFEHSLGVGYLAGEFTKKLREKQREEEKTGSRNDSTLITDEDILCVTIAGLCHDLGHGPFSHLFDGQFIPKCNDPKSRNWKHEHASLMMFDHMIKENNLEDKFKEYMYIGESDSKKDEKIKQDLIFIKELIGGALNGDGKPLTKDEIKTQEKNGWVYSGRDKEKEFLYEIISNKRNEIDVDKFDYFARDCHHLGIENNFDHKRYMQFAKVIQINSSGGKEWHISIGEKDAGNLYDMFCTRNALHRRAYRHKTTVIIEHMLIEALCLANPHLKFSYKDDQGKIVEMKMSETIHDMRAYTKVTDGVYDVIRNSEDPKLQPARKILEQIEKRELYKFVGQSKPAESDEPNRDMSAMKKTHRVMENEEEIQKKIAEIGKSRGIKQEDIVVKLNKFNFGKGDQNPLEDYWFYSKNPDKQPFTLKATDISGMIPGIFQEDYVLVYSKKRDAESVKALKKCFQSYCEKNGMIESMGGW